MEIRTVPKILFAFSLATGSWAPSPRFLILYLPIGDLRCRKPIRATSAEDIQRALDKWILPEIGDLPLSEAAKYAAMKGLVAKMNAGQLSPKSVNTYFRIAAAVVNSAEDNDGNPLYPRKWDPEKLDLPIVDSKQQRRPTIDEKTMTFLASCRKPEERRLFIVCGATGMRIGEVLGLEIDKDFADDCPECTENSAS